MELREHHEPLSPKTSQKLTTSQNKHCAGMQNPNFKLGHYRFPGVPPNENPMNRGLRRLLGMQRGGKTNSSVTKIR